MPNYITLLTSRSMNSEHFEHQMLVTISDDVTSGKISDNVASSKISALQEFLSAIVGEPVDDILCISIHRDRITQPIQAVTDFDINRLDRFPGINITYTKNALKPTLPLIMLSSMLKEFAGQYVLKCGDGGFFTIITAPPIVPCFAKPSSYVCSCSKSKPCFCGMGRFRDAENPNFYSIGEGKWHGSFRFDGESDLNTLYQFIQTSEYAKKYCFVEQKTTQFKMFFDIDFKSLARIGLGEMYPLIDRLADLVVCTIARVMDSPYIYSDKVASNTVASDKVASDTAANNSMASDSVGDNLDKHQHGIHLYFPNVIVTKPIGLMHATIVTQLLLKCDTFPDITLKQWNQIIDCAVYKNNGLKLLFQTLDGYHYKINKEKSTWREPISDDIGQQLKLTSIRIIE